MSRTVLRTSTGVALPLSVPDLITMVDALSLMSKLTIDDDERDNADNLADDLTMVVLSLKGS